MTKYFKNEQGSPVGSRTIPSKETGSNKKIPFEQIMHIKNSVLFRMYKPFITYWHCCYFFRLFSVRLCAQMSM